MIRKPYRRSHTRRELTISSTGGYNDFGNLYTVNRIKAVFVVRERTSPHRKQRIVLAFAR